MPSPSGGPDVRSYSAEALFDVLSGPRFSAAKAKEHAQAQYLHRYLTDIGAATIVVEHDYVDGDYLADFASYYVSCFEPYARFCKRLHFFASAFDEAHITQAVLGKLGESEITALRDAYLGFVVVRPLPDAVVGRTVLRPYPSDSGRRNYTAVVPYNVTLHGIGLRVISLAYQEQDTVLAACATVAIWSALHRTAHVYGTRAPRPPVITADATRSVLYQRALPSTGLRTEQMMAAIRSADLDPEVYEPVTSNSIRPLASLIYGYSKGGLPVILVVNVDGLGPHAVTITGFSLRANRVFQRESPEFLLVLDANGQEQRDGNGNLLTNQVDDSHPLVGLRIDEFYAHDDGAGPFSRLVAQQPTPGKAYRPDDIAWRTRFNGQWYHSDGTVRNMLPLFIIVPVYPKIRLHFDVVQSWVARLHRVLMASVPQIGGDAKRVEWDVHITDTNAYKHEVPRLPLSDDRKIGLLLSSQPRFLWRAIFKVDDTPVVEILLDATSFAKAFPVSWINFFDEAATRNVDAIIRTGNLDRLLTPSLSALILREIAQRTSSTIGHPQIGPLSPGSAF